MNALFIVLTAVLITGTAQASESLVSCYTPEETVKKVKNELSGEVEVYGLQIKRNRIYDDLFTGTLRGRKAKHSDDNDSNISTNTMLADVNIVKGAICEVTFSFDKSKIDCSPAADRPGGCFYDEAKVTFSGAFLNHDGSRDADFYYKNPEEGQSLLSRALGIKSEISKQARALKCHADIDLVRDLCQKRRAELSKSYDKGAYQ